MIPFGWYGGKFSHLSWLLPLLPEADHFCDVFGGSGVVLLNRAPSPIETYNDLDGNLCNFFRQLRDNRDALIEKLLLTPYSREEFVSCLAGTDDELESARRFFVRARMVRTGLAQAASEGRWATVATGSRRGMSGVVSRYLGGVEGLYDVATRFLSVQIENRPALKVMEMYDRPGTLFYVDPPYVHSTRGDKAVYSSEMSDDDHVALLEKCCEMKGKVAISGYRSALYDERLSDWKRIDVEKTNHSTKDVRVECLWVNY